MCRDSAEKVIAGFAEWVIASSTREVEALALQAALLYLEEDSEMKQSDLHMDLSSGNLLLSKIITGEESCTWTLWPIIQECKEKLARSSSVKLAFGQWESNQVADWITMIHRKMTLPPKWLAVPPSPLRDLLCSENHKSC